MVDLKGQYLKIKKEVDYAIQNVVDKTAFINGSEVGVFKNNLSEYLGVKHVITCANGTDALQIALMALDLKIGDEVIVPAFTYVATAEVIALLKLKPVLVDVDIDTFNINVQQIEAAINEKTKAIVPVHLFGQCANMQEIMYIAEKHNLYVIEDNAQAIGADYIYINGKRQKTGTIGDIGCTSFFPSKNLGCFGDGGAIFTNNDKLAFKLQIIANHGQNKKYYHQLTGVNSRLDTIQAAVLNIKIKHLDEYSNKRQKAAKFYSENLKNNKNLVTPICSNSSTHVFHQYTLLVKNGKRDELKQFLNKNGIPANIYYPMPLNKQEAFKNISRVVGDLKNTKELCSSVLSLPMHTELDNNQLEYIIEKINQLKFS